MLRSIQRENIRRVREEIQQVIEQRTCCPLSFCCSTDHKTIADCNHPEKYNFIGIFHNSISRQCYEMSRIYQIEEIINEIKNKYMTEEHITDEQIEILLVRLSIPAYKTWGKTRDEKINTMMKKYAQLLTDAYHYEYEYWTEPEEPEEPEDDETMFPMEIDQVQEEPVPETDPTKIQLLFKETTTIHGYLTEPNEPNTLLECPICYETECFITTNCRHVFCECILKHIAQSQNQIEGNTISCCPCCREPISILEISHKKNYKIISSMAEFYTETNSTTPSTEPPSTEQ